MNDDKSTLYRSLESSDNTDLEIGDSHEEMTFWPTYMNILSTLTGAEVLSVSNSMTFMGLFVSLAMMTGTTLLSYFGTIMVLLLQKKVSAESINDLATKIVGPWGGTVYSALTLCFTYSCQTAYLIIGVDSVTQWVAMLGFESWTTGVKRAILVLVYSLLIPVALSIPREMKILSLISTSAIGVQAIYVSGMIYEGFKYLGSRGIDITTEQYTGGMEFFQAFAIYSMLYAFPSVVLPLVRYYPKDMGKRYFLIGASFVSCFSISLVPGVIGYLIFGTDSHQIVISSFPSSEIIIQIIRTGFFLVVNASFAVVSITVMQDISSLMYSIENPSDLPFTKRVIALFLANALPVGIAMILPEVRPVFEVGGAFGGCLSNFFVPPILWVVQSHQKLTHPLNMFMILFAIFGLVSAGIATYQAVLDALDPND